MRVEDLPAVQAIEQASFTTPWPPHAYRSELETNRLAQYLVVRAEGEVVGYAGDLADGRRGAHHDVRGRIPRWRRRRIGERLLARACSTSRVDRRAREATLEVRLSNLAARRLYEKYGFRPVGLRPRYYSDDHEDALIMTTEPLATRSAMRARVDAELRDGRSRAGATRSTDAASRTGARSRVVSGPLVLAIESSCDETGIALVEGGRRIHANVVASQVALHAADRRDRPRGRGAGPPPLDRAGPRRGAGEPPASAWDDVDAVAVTYGPGLAGSLLVGINFAKTLAWVHDKPLVGVNHLEGHVYAAWLLDPGQDAGREPRRSRSSRWSSRAGTRSSSRCATTSPTGCSARPSTTPRARRSTRSGRLLGLPYPGGPAIQRAAEAADGARPGLPAGLAARHVRLLVLGAEDGGAADRRRRRAPEAGSRRTAPSRCPDAMTAELAWGFQDSVVDVLATKTIRAAEATRRAGDRPGRRRRGEQRRSASGSPARRRPGAGCR